MRPIGTVHSQYTDTSAIPAIIDGRDRGRYIQEYRAYESLFLTLLPLGLPIIRFAESFRLHAAMAEFLRREIYVNDGIPYFSQRHEVLPPFEHPDPFVAAVLSPQHPIIVVVHNEATSQVRNPFEQALIAPVLQALADPGRRIGDRTCVVERISIFRLERG